MSRWIGRPEPGFYKRRLTKGGVWVAVRFFIDDGGALRVEVDGQTERHDGEPFDPHELWPICWPSSETEYKFFGLMREWAQRHAPHFPQARPWQAIDLGALPPRRRP